MADILKIVTEVQRKPFEINGATYYLKAAEELPLADQMKLSAIGREYEAVERLDPTSSEFEAALIRATAALDDAVRTVTVGIPNDVYSMLTDLHKTQIVEAFSMGFHTAGSDSSASSESLPALQGSTISTPIV